MTISSSEAARALGRLTSPKKAATARLNLIAANAAKAGPVCSCGRTPHRSTCRVILAQRNRESRRRKKERRG